ncbi:unnamed protein product [Brassica napus]|uniref:(rape) hypothetical protein n=1 Tax=Brassica napus TaxID=3708 RepID=A0A816IQD4_BRANA|nr:unnamed protein product [Brassica napus]
MVKAQISSKSSSSFHLFSLNYLIRIISGFNLRFNGLFVDQLLPSLCKMELLVPLFMSGSFLFIVILAMFRFKSPLSPKAPKMVVVLGADEAILYEGNSKRTVMLSNKTCTISFPAVGHVNVRPGGEIWYQLWWRGIIPFAAAGGCAIEVPVGGLFGFRSSFKEFADLRWSGDDSFVWCGYEFDD